MNFFEPPILYYRRATGDNHHLIYLRPLRRRPERCKSQLGAELPKPDWDQIQPRPFEKNIYREHPTTASRSAAAVDDYRRANGVVIVKGRGPVANPILDFEEARSFPDDLVDAVRKERNGGTPTCIEAQCWPIVLSGRDFLGVVQAGSSKTHAYVVPAIAHSLSFQRPPNTGDGPLVVVLAPSRELVQQIHHLFRDLGQSLGLRSVCVHSGVAKGTQYAELALGCDVCIGTPGRLLEFVTEQRLKLFSCTFLVVDGADRMLAMGLEREVAKIAQQIRPDRQTVMWVGSWPKGTRRLIESLLDDYVQVNFGSAQPRAMGVKQSVCVVKKAEKEHALAELLEDLLRDEVERVVVFTKTQEAVRKVASRLRERNWRTVVVHRGMALEQRRWTLSTFRAGGFCVLLSTHGCGRDLALDGVRFLINLDFPVKPYGYAMFVNQLASVADEGGQLYTFFTPDDCRHAEELVATLRQAGQVVPRELCKLAKETCASVRPGRRAK
ncbi:probable ATP-dependent RNA helicase DDX5 [Rhipicephalus sanguineus]|uniref:RNA helicase n=1 Tax=Rhipicephalus sanguineus TaxID=34632 RepID=A0A9D4SMC9_RHISA|nr:probable ATP-dependent RNA helicase DDX5 [Rhipicephalus sanguineus]KAH7935193.1 hypothetical protein HPB52_004781 [Rhipicephalus sanguineus]